MDRLFEKIALLEKVYEQHFGTTFPERMIGWWDPLNATEQEIEIGIKKMQKDINRAIRTNIPIEGMSEEEWEDIVF